MNDKLSVLTRMLEIARKKSGLLLPVAGILFGLAAFMPRRGISKEIWFAIILPGKLLLLFFCLVFLLLYVAQSEKVLQRRMSVSPGRVALFVFLGTLLVIYLAQSFWATKGLSNYVFSWGPDGTSFFTQAKIFAEGSISVPSHKLPEFFQTGYCINNGKFFSEYPPGWPAILSLGIVLKLSWIVNPILTCISLYIIYLLGNSLCNREIAWIAIILAGASPMLTLGASNYISEPASLFFSVLFFYAAIQALKFRNCVFPILAGLCLGGLFLTRPYSALAIAFPMACYWLFKLAKQHEILGRGILLLLAFLPLAVLHLVYNFYQTGSPWTLPFTLYNSFDKLGFGLRSNDTFIPPFYYGPLTALRNLILNIIDLNWRGLPLLFVLVFPVFIGRRKKWDLLLTCTVASIMLFHLLYFFRDSRYYYPALFAFFLLAARGFVELGGFLQKHLCNSSSINLKGLLTLFPALCSLLLIIFPGKGRLRISPGRPDF